LPCRHESAQTNKNDVVILIRGFFPLPLLFPPTFLLIFFFFFFFFFFFPFPFLSFRFVLLPSHQLPACRKKKKNSKKIKGKKEYSKGITK